MQKLSFFHKNIEIPIIETVVRVIDVESDGDMPRGKERELLTKGPQVMKGYWKNPKET